MINKLFYLGIIICLCTYTFGQQPVNTEKKVYINEKGRIYINRTLPVYLRITTDSSETAKTYLLKSEQTTKYSNPMYFDTEGRNTVRSPWAVDPNTMNMVYPQQDIIYEVYADSKAPSSKLRGRNTKSYIYNQKVYYGNNHTLEISAYDQVSGIDEIFYSINSEPYKEYKEPLVFTEEKDYELKYYATDRVGNMENIKSKSFTIDKTPPETNYEIKGLMKGNMVSPDAMIELKSKDNITGVKRIMYSLNNGPEVIYKTPISVKKFAEGGTNMYFYAIDNLDNKEEKKSSVNKLSDVTEANADIKKNVVFEFYVDNEPPEISFNIETDSYQGKYLFISPNSQIKIDATDSKSGLDKIFYSINSTSLSEEYKAPFTLEKEGIQYFHYAAVDFVGNRSKIMKKTIYLDKKLPASKITFNGPKYTRRDTLFISNKTKITLTGTDVQSGKKELRYSVNNGQEQVYSEPIMLEKEGANNIIYYTVDKVNNKEDKKTITVILDNTAPEIIYNFSVESIGKKTVRDEDYVIYPANTILYLAATDKLSGSEIIEYKINNSAPKTTLPISGFAPGNYEIEVVAYDALKNKSASKTITFSIEN